MTVAPEGIMKFQSKLVEQVNELARILVRVPVPGFMQGGSMPP